MDKKEHLEISSLKDYDTQKHPLKSPLGGLRGPRIFVSAYACEPGLGSEIGVGWHWVLEMSKYFDLWVLTRKSNQKRIENWMAEHPDSPDIKFIYYDLPDWARKWKKGLRGVRTYYNLWTRFSNPLVKKTMMENDIKVFHHITYGNALWPVSKFGASQFFIWGPIGGLETIPEEYSQYYEGKSKWIETARRIAVKKAVKSRALRRRAEKASLILCKTQETLERLPLENKDKAVLFTDVACDIPGNRNVSTPHRSGSLPTSINSNTGNRNVSLPNRNGSLPTSINSYNLMVVGRLDSWRGFDLAILALGEAIKKLNGLNLHLNIVGKGDDSQRLKKIVKDNSLEPYVTFLGEVSKEEYHRLMAETDVVLNPSLKEGAVTVSFDAMTLGKPLISLDTGGYTRYFNPDYSVVIPKENRNITIRNIANAIVKLSDPKLREKMGLEAIEASNKFTWENHGKEIYDVITERIGKGIS